jgi:hypothetical protein
MRNPFVIVGITITAVVGWSCGAQMMGELLQDAGARLSDAGVARAQASCTWQVRRVSQLDSSGRAYASEVSIPAGWEPFGNTDVSVLIRRCQ